MRKILAFLLVLAMFFGSVCALASCGNGVNLSDKTTTKDNDNNGKTTVGDDDNDKTTSKDNNKENNNKENKYDNIKAIVGAYDDVYVYQNYNGKYGLLSPDGDIIYDGFYLYQTFSENSNYILCYDGKNDKVSSILDKNGKTVLEVGKDNIEFISKITQGRILAYKMTDERPSGKTYDLICYSAKDMSEVFRLSGQDEIISYISFDKTGYIYGDYAPSDSEYTEICFDIYGNTYYQKISNRSYRYYDSDGKEYIKQSYGGCTSEQYGLPKVSGIEESEDIDWYDLVYSYSEYKNSSNKTYNVGATNNTLGQIATLYMKSTSEWCATMDENGKILMQPTKDIMLKYEYNFFGTVTKLYTFSNDLCCAYQPSSGLWGYVDPYGNWKIKPQYNNVTTFSYDGLAVVDNLIVIDTKGKVVLDISGKGDIHPLEGKYKLSGGAFSSYLTFSRDGSVVSKYNSLIRTGTYEVHGDSLVIDGFGYTAALMDGTYTFEQGDDKLYINGNLWVLIDD